MARAFDGSNDYIDVAATAAVNVNNNDFTVAIWLKSSTAPSSNDRLLSKGTTSGGTGGGVRYEVILEVDGGSSSLDFTIDDNSTKTNISYGTVTDLSDGNWHLWIFERDAGLIPRYSRMVTQSERRAPITREILTTAIRF